MLNERFMQHWHNEQDISIDERSMVPYYGRHSSKQFIRGKPIRFGFKVWCLNSRLGYLIQCDPYQGSSATYNADLGLGGSVGSQLMSKLPTGPSYRRSATELAVEENQLQLTSPIISLPDLDTNKNQESVNECNAPVTLGIALFYGPRKRRPAPYAQHPEHLDPITVHVTPAVSALPPHSRRRPAKYCYD